MREDRREVWQWTRVTELRRGTRECVECLGRIKWGTYKREVFATSRGLYPQFTHYDPPCGGTDRGS